MQTGESARVADIKGWKHAEALAAAPLALPATRWPRARVAAVEALWGERYAAPGGAPETLRLIKPLALSSSVTVLLLGGGFGGPARTICDSFGAWVASFEADEEQRHIAASRCGAAEGGKPRISVSTWDRAAPAFRPRSANHAFMMEALRGAQPAPVLQSLANALSANSQIVLTELVAETPPSVQDREFAAWCRLDNRLPLLPKAQEVTDAFQALGYEVRVAEDMSDRHITQTLSGWRDAVRVMAAGPRPAAHTAAAFVTEAELWLLRIRLMRRLGVRLMRWHAIRSA